jgi:hypothetical protein
MPIEFNSILGNINNSIYSIPLLNTIFSNVFYTSIILSILLLVVLILVFPSDELSPWVLTKMFFYLTVINTLILSTYNSVISNKYKSKLMDDNNDKFINTVTGAGTRVIYAEDAIKVTPNFDHSHESYEESQPSLPMESSDLSPTNMLDMLEKQI